MRPKSMLWRMLAALTAGETAGSILYVLFPAAAVWNNAFLAHGLGILGGGCRDVCSGIALHALLWIGLFAAAGITVMSVSLAQLLVFLHGIMLGAKLAFLYRGQVVTGLVTALLFVMPFAVMQTALLLLAAREAMRSEHRLRRRFGRQSAGETRMRTYTARFAVLAVGMLLLALMQGMWMGMVYPAVLRALTAPR